MLERRAILTGGAVIAAAGAATRAVAQGGSMPGMRMSMSECIDLCTASHRMCLETGAYLVRQGGGSASASLIAMLNDCAELCQATANSMLRESPVHAILCGACADACERCAEECQRHGGDQRMALCATACKKCAESCRSMASIPA